MWTAKFFAVTLVITVFIRDAESWKPRRRGGSLLPCSPRVCQVSSWSAWSPCTHLCGTTGTQTRARTVAVTATCGGSCPHLSEIRSCNRDNCQNSGTPSRNGCSCPPGYVGTCCEIVPGSGSCTSLITSNGNVQFTSSSSSQGPGNPVLHSNDVWCAGVVNANQYLKVDLGAVMLVEQVSVQGKANSNKSVSEYYIKTSTDNINFNFVLEGSRRKVFFGPFFDGKAVVTTKFILPVQARYVLFNPREPLTVSSNHLCLRVDIASCQNGKCSHLNLIQRKKYKSEEDLESLSTK
ncbi:coadhesin-like [Orbicella faveolata]|uniref:coadhesin-like n=1 Tax=Orbicella faveolata TaxID=48498 RepID=UPI0009E55F6E|nr:coadhesin-like [Orbicella faveolata]